MLTRRVFSLIPACFSFSLQESAPSNKDLYLEAKDLLIKGKKLKRSIQLFEKCSQPDAPFLSLCACTGRLASIAFATLEWNGFLQEKENLEYKKKKTPDLEISLPSVRTPDDNKEFDFNAPSNSNEIKALTQKVLTLCTVIDKILTDSKEQVKSEESLKNRHLYISALVLLNRVLSVLPDRFTNNKKLTECCAPEKLTRLIDTFLEHQPAAYELLYLKGIVKTLPLIHLHPHRKLIAFSLGDMDQLGLSPKDITESLSYLDTVTAKSSRNREAMLYKSLLLYLSDKGKSTDALAKFIQTNPAHSIFYLFKAELLFQAEKTVPFEPLKQASESPIFGDFVFSLPVRFELKACYRYLNCSSGLILSRSLSSIFSRAQSHFQSIMPENMTGEHLQNIEILLNLGTRAIDSFQKQRPSNYQEAALQKNILLLGIVNVYGAYELVKKANMLSYSEEKNTFLEKYSAVIEYVKNVDTELTQ